MSWVVPGLGKNSTLFVIFYFSSIFLLARVHVIRSITEKTEPANAATAGV